GGILGARGKFIGAFGQFSGFSTYGEYTLIGSTGVKNSITTEYGFNGDRIRGDIRDTSYPLTITGVGNTRAFTFASSFPDFYALLNPVFLLSGSTAKFGGIVTGISGSNITVSYVPDSVTDGTWQVI